MLTDGACIYQPWAAPFSLDRPALLVGWPNSRAARYLLGGVVSNSLILLRAYRGHSAVSNDRIAHDLGSFQRISDSLLPDRTRPASQSAAKASSPKTARARPTCRSCSSRPYGESGVPVLSRSALTAPHRCTALLTSARAPRMAAIPRQTLGGPRLVPERLEETQPRHKRCPCRRMVTLSVEQMAQTPERHGAAVVIPDFPEDAQGVLVSPLRLLVVALRAGEVPQLVERPGDVLLVSSSRKSASPSS